MIIALTQLVMKSSDYLPIVHLYITLLRKWNLSLELSKQNQNTKVYFALQAIGTVNPRETLP